MGFLDGLFGKKRDVNFDWLELNGPLKPRWEEIQIEDAEGLEYSIDRSSCYVDGEIVWWKQRVGIPDDEYDYLICGASISTRGVMIPICRTLSDPEQKQVRPDTLNQMTRADVSTPFGECLKRATMWAQFNSFSTIPPYVFYAMTIVNAR